jgi:prevent-host-death family protein
MRTHPFHKARAEFSALVDRALSGEPQRVTRHGKDSVVIVSEAEWNKRAPKYANLGELLADIARRGTFSEDMFDRGLLGSERPLGEDFLRDP